jgi:undecaprenyl-diphosphatase
MFNEILLAFIQGATEFLPISSSGHLALISNIISSPNIFFFILLHLASLLAVMFFLRKDLINLFSFNKEYSKIWIYWIIATIPGALFGFLFNDLIESVFSSYLFLGIAFIFTGAVLYFTKNSKNSNKKINSKNSLIVGLAQVFALFPGISRSGMTISAGLFQGIDREKAVRFSFLLFIPLSIGSFILELLKVGSVSVTSSLVVSFVFCFFVSLLFLNVLTKIIKNDKFWVFSFYCWFVGIISLLLFFL